VLPIVVLALAVPSLLVVAGGPAGAAGGTFTATLTGTQEVPPNASTATGTASVTLDAAETTITVSVVFSGLDGAGTVAAHIHGPAAPGVNGPVVITFPSFPLGVTSGAYSNSLAITAAQVTDLRAGLYYVNIHSTPNFLGGEIRGQLTEVLPPTTTAPAPTSVPAAAPVAATPRVTG
jgi:hypothetical protein